MDSHKLVCKTHGSEGKKVIKSIKHIMYVRHAMFTFFFKCYIRVDLDESATKLRTALPTEEGKGLTWQIRYQKDFSLI